MQEETRLWRSFSKAQRAAIWDRADEGGRRWLAFYTATGGPPHPQTGEPTPWWTAARDDQLPPLSLYVDKLIWLVLAGRGWGKTRTGAEWVHNKALELPGSRGALIAKDPGEARDVMIEGVSGIMACAPGFDRPVYNPSLKRVTWPNGTIAGIFSSEDYEELRGPQHHWLWADEPFKWKNIEKTWDQATLGLRLGARPQACLTSTPRPLKLLKRLLADPLVHLTRGSTTENIQNLSPFYLALVDRLKGTRLGRQELEAAILDDNPGALWTYSMFEREGFRLAALPRGVSPQRTVIGVDPMAVSMSVEDRRTRDSDDPSDVSRRATGIVVASLGTDGRGYVMDDRTIHGRPEVWGSAVVKAFRDWAADRITAEQNQGGDMVDSTIRNVDRHAPVRMVHAAKGKITRAEPISALYERGLISHVGSFPDLEDEMCTYVPGDHSPNRMDALVWALTELFGHDIADMSEAEFQNNRTVVLETGRVVGGNGNGMNIGVSHGVGAGGMNL